MPAEVSLEDPQSFWSNFVHPRVAHIQKVSLFDAANLVSDARQALDDELAAMHLAMCALRTRRNALAPISKLPPEVLARIFKHHADIQPSSGGGKPRLGWIQVTHVCRHWRITALQQPYLWTNIVSSIGSEWQELNLDRAKTLPISFSDTAYTSEKGLVAKHLFHIHDLVLHGRTSVLQHVLPTLTSSAPLLESLQIRSSGPYFSAPTPVLPLNILNGHSPRLRQLVLYGVLVHWSAPILQNLTRLSINCGIDSDAGAWSELPMANSRQSHLIEALQKMPALETLSLERCLPRFPSSVSNQVVDLRCLKKLYMRDTSDRCTGILKHLRVPPCCLSLVMKGPVDIHDILPFFHAYARVDGEGEVPFLTLALTFDGGHYTVTTWRTYLEADIRNNFKPRLDHDLRIQFIRSGQSPDLVQSLCRALPLQSLRRLSIHNSHVAWSSQNWIDTFGQCTALEHILLDGRNVVQYCGGPLQPDHAPFLNLRSLWLTGLNFHDDIIHASGGTSVFHVAFLAWLTARKERGPLFKLIIKDCRVTKAYVTELKQILEVEWK